MIDRHLSCCIDCEWECKLGLVCFLLWFIASFLARIASFPVRTERNGAARKSFFRTALLLLHFSRGQNCSRPIFRAVRFRSTRARLLHKLPVFRLAFPRCCEKRVPVPGFRRVSFTVKVTWHFCFWFIQIDVLRKIMASLVCVTVIILTGSNYPIARNGGNGKWYFKINFNFFSIFCD